MAQLWAQHVPAIQRVTVADLLGMTSGAGANSRQQLPELAASREQRATVPRVRGGGGQQRHGMLLTLRRVRLLAGAPRAGTGSGIKDYDGLMYMDWTLLFGHEDGLLPCDLLNMLDKTLLCPMPPCPGFYSSINFVLLGFVMQV